MGSFAQSQRNQSVLRNVCLVVDPGCEEELSEVEGEEDELREEMGWEVVGGQEEMEERGGGRSGWQVGEKSVEVEVESWISVREKEQSESIEKEGCRRRQLEGDLHKRPCSSFELRIVSFSSQETSNLFHVGGVVDLGIFENATKEKVVSFDLPSTPAGSPSCLPVILLYISARLYRCSSCFPQVRTQKRHLQLTRHESKDQQAENEFSEKDERGEIPEEPSFNEKILDP